MKVILILVISSLLGWVFWMLTRILLKFILSPYDVYATSVISVGGWWLPYFLIFSLFCMTFSKFMASARRRDQVIICVTIVLFWVGGIIFALGLDQNFTFFNDQITLKEVNFFWCPLFGFLGFLLSLKLVRDRAKRKRSRCQAYSCQ